MVTSISWFKSCTPPPPPKEEGRGEEGHTSAQEQEAHYDGWWVLDALISTIRGYTNWQKTKNTQHKTTANKIGHTDTVGLLWEQQYHLHLLVIEVQHWDIHSNLCFWLWAHSLKHQQARSTYSKDSNVVFCSINWELLTILTWSHLPIMMHYSACSSTFANNDAPATCSIKHIHQQKLHCHDCLGASASADNDASHIKWCTPPLQSNSNLDIL